MSVKTVQAVINGQTYNLTLNSNTGKYEATVTALAEGFVTNQAKITVSGTTDDTTSKPVTVTVNGEQAAVGEGGAWSKEITLTPGKNTITVVAADKAGKSTTVTRNVTLDTGAPVIRSVTMTPNPVDAGKTFIISVEVTD